jgi:hypothetical protein
VSVVCPHTGCELHQVDTLLHATPATIPARTAFLRSSSMWQPSPSVPLTGQSLTYCPEKDGGKRLTW